MFYFIFFSRRTPKSKRPKVPPKPRTVEKVICHDPVEVFCRIRPTDNLDFCIKALDHRTVKVSF